VGRGKAYRPHSRALPSLLSRFSAVNLEKEPSRTVCTAAHRARAFFCLVVLYSKKCVTPFQVQKKFAQTFSLRSTASAHSRVAPSSLLTLFARGHSQRGVLYTHYLHIIYALATQATPGTPRASFLYTRKTYNIYFFSRALAHHSLSLLTLLTRGHSQRETLYIHYHRIVYVFASCAAPGIACA